MKRTMEDASQTDDDLAARRERGRKAQRAFRQRQITAINELREQNQAMQDAITSLARVAARLGSTELKDAVRHAQNAAGMENSDDVDDSYDECVRYGEPSRSQPKESSTAYLMNMSESGKFLDNGPTANTLSFSGNYQIPLSYRIDDGSSTPYKQSVANGQQLGYQSGRMSPRLSYGLFLERPLFRLTNPPVDIMPFLESSTTLSSVVFWTGLVWGFKLLQAALEGNRQAAATAQKIFGEIVPMKPDRTVLNGIHARLKFRNLGYVESDHPGYDPEGGIRIRNMMAQTCASNGTPLETYLRPDGAEEYIRNRLGEGYRAIELGLKGQGSLEDLSRVRQLIEKMIRSSVCLGDGPRWRINRLGKVLDSWLEGSITHV
ncbi:hypothetical protein CI238_03489 [Colletotrichum incanum]|uniref:Uncharacterized protein n=1 Tax=Colletotrichum incanum TaxID=1573173 RepID=A0A166Z365_COLIC|nr:hypothetical protein CI238_03489 [Colletotrichum incanum]